MKNYLSGYAQLTLPVVIKLSAAHHTNTIKATSPTTNANLTLSDCSTYTHMLVQVTGGGQPANGDGRWVACSSVVGALTSPNLSNGVNNLEVWLKTNTTVEATATATISITVTP